MSVIRCTVHVVTGTPSGHIEQLPSGSWRARVYAGIDPITKREIRLKATAKTERQAHIELVSFRDAAQDHVKARTADERAAARAPKVVLSCLY